MTIAIHQPNLFPWLGYFNKILLSDTFVFLDHVVNNPRSAIYTKRVQMLSGGVEYWLTIPLKNKKNETFIPINEMEIDNPQFIASKQLKTIELNYKKAPFFNEVFDIITCFYEHESNLIAVRNIDFIVSICKKLEIEKGFKKSSEMPHNQNSTQLLIEITSHLQGTTYLSGDGAEGYQEKELYQLHGIKLAFTDFKHPVYSQFNSKSFIKGLSIIDALMSLGFEGTKKLLLLSLLTKQE